MILLSERYIELEQYIKICKEDQETELRSIARSLGAVKCLLERHEKIDQETIIDLSEERLVHLPMGRKKANTGESQSASIEQKNSAAKSIVFSQCFSGAEPQRPALKWFAHDKKIIDFIESRCTKDANITTEYSFDITSSSSTYMNADYAAKIDASLGKTGASGAISFAARYNKETNERLIFKVWFN